MNELRTLGEAFPPDTFLFMLSDPEDLKWVFDVDPVRVACMGSAIVSTSGRLPLITHQAGATPEILDLFAAAGLPCPLNLLTFRSHEEAVALARAQLKEGRRMAYAYPPVSELRSDPGLLFPMELYSRLNNKKHLPHYVPETARPQRWFFPPEEVTPHLSPPAPFPLYLKAAQPGASGAGRDVRAADDPASWREALAFFLQRKGELDGLVIEEGIDVVTSWCLGVSILDDTIHDLGGAIQLFIRPSVQNGNLIDPARPPPPLMRELAFQISRKAQAEGFRGVAGFDIGVDPAGRCFVFDLNFRLNGSTIPLLLHDDAIRRANATMSRSWRCSADMPFADLVRRIRPMIEEKTFLPTRLFDRDTYLKDHPGTTASNLLNGMLMGTSVEELDELAVRMSRTLT